MSHAQRCPLNRGAESAKRESLGSGLVQWKEPARSWETHLALPAAPWVAEARPFASPHLQKETIQPRSLLFCSHSGGHRSGWDTDHCNPRTSEINITRGENKRSVHLLQGWGRGQAQLKAASPVMGRDAMPIKRLGVLSHRSRRSSLSSRDRRLQGTAADPGLRFQTPVRVGV